MVYFIHSIDVKKNYNLQGNSPKYAQKYMFDS